ncbi:MAG: hypothetical protein WDM77_08630 [Steroidobacteraceae bacterium]
MRRVQCQERLTETDAPKLGSSTSAAGRGVAKLLKCLELRRLSSCCGTASTSCRRVVKPIARVTVRDPSVLWGLLRNPGVRFGDGYSDGRIEIEGDLVAFMEEVYRGSDRADKQKSVLGLIGKLMNRPRVNTLAGSKDNIHHHYDIGNDFYSLWLGGPWRTPAPTTPPAMPPWIRPRTPRCTMSAGSCACVPVSGWSRPASAGAAWPRTWHAIMA